MLKSATKKRKKSNNFTSKLKRSYNRHEITLIIGDFNAKVEQDINTIREFSWQMIRS